VNDQARVFVYTLQVTALVHDGDAHRLVNLAGLHISHPHPTWAVDLRGHVITANPALLKYLGTEPPALLGYPMSHVVHPDDRAALSSRTLEDVSEFRLRRHDGEYRLFQVSSRAVTEGDQLHGWLLSGVDIQDIRSSGATDQLAELQTIIDGSSDCIKVLDLGAQLLTMNAGGMKVMEVDDFNACRLAFWPSFWEGETRPLVEQAVQAAREGHTSVFEGPARTMKGALKFWEVTVSPIRDKGGRVQRLFAISRDITPRRRQQDLISRQSALLEQIATGMPLDGVFRHLRQFIQDQSDGLHAEVTLRDSQGRERPVAPTPDRREGAGETWDAASSTPGAQQDQGRRHAGHLCREVPVQDMNGERQGTIQVFTPVQRLLTQDEEQLITAAARLAQVAVERGRLEQAEGDARQDQQRSEAAFREQAEILWTLNDVNQLVSAELDLDRLVQAVTDAGVELTGAAFGAFFYNQRNEEGESYTLYTLSGVSPDAFSSFPMPRNTQVFGPTFEGKGIIRVHDITQDPRYGHNLPYQGMPEGHLPVRSYLAAPVKSRSGEVLGGLFFGHPDPGVFSARAEHLAAGLASQAAVALDNARLFGQLQGSHAQLERRVHERTQELEAQAMSLDAFAAFTEAVGTETDVLTLAQEAIAVLRTRFPDDTIGYYEPEGELWKLQVWTDAPVEILKALQDGLPSDTPMIRRILDARAPAFTDAWNADEEQLHGTTMYAAVGGYPLTIDGQVRGILSIGRTRTAEWTGRDRALFSAVGRSFTLALERAAQTTHIAAQRDALEARSRALEAFALLTKDLNVDADPVNLIRRAQEILMSLLPEGYTLYWQPEDTRWISRSQVGSLGHPELQGAVDAGLPRGQAATLDQCWTTRQAVFQDQYAQGADTAAHLVTHVQAAAMLPVLVNGVPHGMIGVGIFEQRQWTPMDEAVLKTVARSLGLALEGALSAQALKDRTRELERSNAELERFAYVASHDLQEPLRTITSFSELVERRYSSVLDERGRMYLGQIRKGSTRMKVLIDDLLVFSRLNAVREPYRATDLAGPLNEALTRLHAAVEESGAVIHHGPLPVVTGDPSELAQLFQNLIGNAIKFRRADVPPEIHVQAVLEDAAWHVTVQDNGIGFEAQYADRVFGMFQRLHSRDQFEGTGLGLAIVKKIVEHHGGRIWAESAPGQGTTIHLTLPALEDT
jgi:PAS domain S-box-containing protein